ncbi:MAG: hypothetical protein AAFU80_14830 [Pseudomonadota bacterium]
MTFLELNEFSDVAASLKLLRVSLQDSVHSTIYWKPCILHSHSALQGACVCILTNTDGTGALAKSSEKELMNKLYGESGAGRNLDDGALEWPEDFIASLPELLKRLPNGLQVRLPEKKERPYPLNTEGDLRRLHEFRNMLVHFPPGSWNLKLSRLPRIISESVSAIERIVTSPDYPRRNRFPETRAQEELICIQTLLRTMETK